MSDYSIKNLKDTDNYGGFFFKLGRDMGVTSFGLNMLVLSAGHSTYPEHDHQDNSEEEIYIVTKGSANLIIDGKDHEIKEGQIARVGAKHKRKIIPGPDGVTIIAAGGLLGKPWPKAKQDK